jgi:hypothetical protein
LMTDPDRAKAKRVGDAMLNQNGYNKLATLFPRLRLEKEVLLRSTASA